MKIVSDIYGNSSMSACLFNPYPCTSEWNPPFTRPKRTANQMDLGSVGLILPFQEEKVLVQCDKFQVIMRTLHYVECSPS